MFFGRVAADRMPAQMNVNTALRSSFFTVILLSSVLDPGGSSCFGWLIEARF
jgi:hypothetical protein